MSCNGVTVYEHVFYAFLKLEAGILADEKDKKKFLDFALAFQRDKKISVLAFVVLDDEIHFLVQSSGEIGTEDTAREMPEDWKKYLQKEHFQALDAAQMEYNCRKIESEKDILDICRYIHRLPLERGYVKRMRDYWWSSFQTYRGIYRWTAVDILPLLKHFSDNTEKGRILFLRYHRRES